MKLILIFLVLIFPRIANAEFDYAAYKSETIDVARAALNIQPDLNYLIEAGNFKYKFTVKYTGNHREISESTKNFISKWVRSLGKPKEFNELFPFEIEIEQNGHTHWLPIQNVLVAPFAQEIKAGSTVTLFIMALGAVNKTPVFAINEFTAK